MGVRKCWRKRRKSEKIGKKQRGKARGGECNSGVESPCRVSDLCGLVVNLLLSLFFMVEKSMGLRVGYTQIRKQTIPTGGVGVQRSQQTGRTE